MPDRFEDYTFEDANEVFSQLKKRIEKAAENRKFLQGDDWQNGKGWVGPQFDSSTKVGKEIKNAIEKEFTSKGDIRAAVRRHQRGVIGRVPGWLISSRNAPEDPAAEPSSADQELISEAQRALNEFWKLSGVHATLKAAVTDFLSTGHSNLRLFFVQSGDEGGQTETAGTIEEAVRQIHLFKEEPESGCIVMNKKTLKKASFFRYETDGNVFIEICYVDGDGKTVFKKLSQSESKTFATKNLPTIGKYIKDDNSVNTDELTLPLGGKLLLFELDGETFVTAAMRSQQKLVNKSYTMLSHNLDISGFRERVILNALPPGVMKKGADGKDVFVPDPNAIEIGAGKVSYVSGLPTTERQSGGSGQPDKIKSGVMTPQIFESDPVPVKTYVDSAAAGSDAILEEADQKHITITGDAAASGESRKEAREAYKQSLEDTKSALDDCMSNVFEAVLAVIAYLMGQDDRYIDLQVTFNALLNPGPVSVEERGAAMNEAKEGFRSKESAMEEMGIADPDAMKEKIKTEEKESPPDPDNDPEAE